MLQILEGGLAMVMGGRHGKKSCDDGWVMGVVQRREGERDVCV